MLASHSVKNHMLDDVLLYIRQACGLYDFHAQNHSPEIMPKKLHRKREPRFNWEGGSKNNNNDDDDDDHHEINLMRPKCPFLSFWLLNPENRLYDL